ncbi:MAG: His/Gly/Thr/Pro-type tRNA ligase C-terminal domain-containing protein [Patescibacteria group bacterium]|nr:His/Gly/Thr/Pro-type tRNA ligase C-terminal domain-containing protein [Patescibacteria group bacterium]
MKQSLFFAKPSHHPPKEEISRSAQLLEQAWYVDKLFAGVYTYLPLGFRVLKKIENIIRQEMNSVGGQELFMPALHPIENYQKTKRDIVDILFHLDLATGKKFVLGFSHEEIIVPLAQRYISSYKDLPLYVYQIQTKFRNELRAKSGIMRSREFIMKDLYSFHATDEDFEEYYSIMQGAYSRIFKAAGVGEKTYLTFASGGTFSKFSHEFQTITDAGEDTIHLCNGCGIAVNDEIIKEQKTCPKCKSARLVAKKSIEVGNIFPLKTKFSDAFGLRFTNAQGVNKPIIMGCYGIGLGRLMGAIVETHCDKKGIIWPANVAPFDLHLLAFGDASVRKNANEAYEFFCKNGIDVLYDNRDVSAGSKMADADLIGIPLRAIISAKTKNLIELKKRSQETTQFLEPEKIITFIKSTHNEN